jgi:hypothetical protein
MPAPRSLIPLLLAPLLAAAALAAPLPLGNPGFESGLDGWIALEGGNPMSRLAADSARSGKTGLRIEDSDTAVGSSLESSPLPAVAGTTFRRALPALSLSTLSAIGA